MPTKAELFARVGGLSKPSKMPGYGWSISAKLCLTGSKLRKIKGSVCASCYALKGRYVFPNVQAAMDRRLAIYKADPVKWVHNMSAIINSTRTDHFRWFDSGDLQDVHMLRNICYVARHTPNTMHWLPTREFGIVSEFLNASGTVPDNLNIRISAPMVGESLDSKLTSYHGVTTSAVTRDKSMATCPAPNQGNKCLDCRACWDRSVEQVVYRAH